MTSLEAKEYLNSFINYELGHQIPYGSSLKLDRVKALLQLIGDPQKNLKIIHVAGTKGKGSTCALIAHILRAACGKVGLYTSPHLNDSKERIRILDIHNYSDRDVFYGKIKEEEFCGLLEELKPAIETVRANQDFSKLSFFEVYTVLALYYFFRRDVKFVVLETGLGGRLDATNAVDSLVCALTPMSLDHTRQLGPTIKDVAREKAAIIKDKNQIVVVAPQKKEAGQIIRERCQGYGVKTFFVGEDINYELIETHLPEQTFKVKTTLREYPHLKMRLLGRHQLINAAVAVGVAESLLPQEGGINQEAIAQGIEETIWPGRFEVVGEDPLVVLDGAHNPESCRQLTATVREIFPRKRVILILGVSADKDTAGIFSELDKMADEVILTKAQHPRALDFTRGALNGLFAGKKIFFASGITEAMTKAYQRAEANNIILVTGSIFIVGEARELCISHP